MVVDHQPTDPAGLEAGSIAAASVALVLPGGRRRAAFELIGAQVPQPGKTAFRVAPPFDEFDNCHARFGLGLE